MQATTKLRLRFVVALLLSAMAVWQPFALPHCPACAGESEVSATAPPQSGARGCGCRCLACAARSTRAAEAGPKALSEEPCSDECVCGRPLEQANVEKASAAKTFEAAAIAALSIFDAPTVPLRRSIAPLPRFAIDPGDRCAVLCRFRT